MRGVVNIFSSGAHLPLERAVQNFELSRDVHSEARRLGLTGLEGDALEAFEHLHGSRH